MEQESRAQTMLDEMVSPEETQMLKAIIPYLPSKFQEIFSVYAKAKELSNTLSLFASSQNRLEMQAAQLPPSDPLEMLNDVRRCCGCETRQKIDEMINMLSMAQMMQLMNETSNPEE